MAGTVLVAGATGYLGRFVVAELARRGRPVRAITRSRPRAEAAGPHGSPSLAGLVTDWVVGEVTDPAFVAGLGDGVDKVISALGVTRQRASPWDVDYRANLSLLREAERAGVDSFLYVNVLHAESGRSLILRSKAAFAAALSRSRVTPQIVNPSGYFSDISAFLDMARRGVVLIPPADGVRVAPIHGADLARFCVDRIDGGPGAWDVGGPDAFTYREIARLAFAALGRRGRTVRVPAAAVRAAVGVASVLGDRPRELARFFADGLVLDAVGEPFGSHHLSDHFRELAAATRPRWR